MRLVATPYGICSAILQKETHNTTQLEDRKIGKFVEFESDCEM